MKGVREHKSCSAVGITKKDGRQITREMSELVTDTPEYEWKNKSK